MKNLHGFRKMFTISPFICKYIIVPKIYISVLHTGIVIFPVKLLFVCLFTI